MYIQDFKVVSVYVIATYIFSQIKISLVWVIPKRAAMQFNSLTTTNQLKSSLISMVSAVRKQHGSSTLSSTFNEASSNKPINSVHHLYMMSTHAVIWDSTLGASSYRARVILKSLCLAWFMSRYISQLCEQCRAADGTWVRQDLLRFHFCRHQTKL